MTDAPCSELAEIRRVADARMAALETARSVLTREESALSAAKERVADAEEAQKVCQIVAQSSQQQANERIATIVTRSLAAVFPDPYEFRITFEQKRGRTEARLSFVRDGVEVSPMDAAGGGMVDVAAFALRLSCVLLAQPPLRRVMVLDEPFKFVSREHRSKLRALITALSSELSVQFIIVTHIPELEMGALVDLSES